MKLKCLNDTITQTSYCIVAEKNKKNYSFRFIMSVTLAKKICFQMNVTLHFQYNFNFFLSTLPSINTSTFLSHNFQCNFKFVFFLGSLVKMLCLMIISFHFLICVQLKKWNEIIIRHNTFILKRREYFFNQNHTMS